MRVSCILQRLQLLPGPGAAQLHAPEVDYKPPPEAKKRGAIIGSAPKLNPEGILAAAREAQAKAEEQRRAVGCLT